jgi:pimeloyl-ACP methyl ester carboxylesterase
MADRLQIFSVLFSIFTLYKILMGNATITMHFQSGINNTFFNPAKVVTWKRNQTLHKSFPYLRRHLMDTSPHRSDILEVNGIHLHYLDWGGRGPVLLFLAGMGCNAHIFDHFATRFTDNFHVLALTRRGHGESYHPETGYDIDTLTQDLYLFLDKMKIERAFIAGHSLAGIEMSHFAALHPERLLGLVYLDAAFYRTLPEFKTMQATNPLPALQNPGQNVDHYSAQDYFTYINRTFPSLAAIWGSVMEQQSLHEITVQPDGKVVDRMSSAIESGLNATLSSYEPEDARIQAPTLSFFVNQDGTGFISRETMTEAQQAQVLDYFQTARLAWFQRCLELFRLNVQHAKIVEIPHGNHYCFIKHEELVFDEMNKFLRA